MMSESIHGVFPKIGGKLPKWMVKIMENPMNKWMNWGGFTTTIFGLTPTYHRWMQVQEF